MSDVDSIAAIELGFNLDTFPELDRHNDHESPSPPPRKTMTPALNGSALFLAADSPSSPSDEVRSISNRDYKRLPAFEILLSPVRNRDEYMEFSDEDAVKKVNRELLAWDNERRFDVTLGNGQRANVRTLSPSLEDSFPLFLSVGSPIDIYSSV